MAPLPSPDAPEVAGPAPVVPGATRNMGLGFMVLSCVAFAAMGALVYAAQLREPQSSPLVASFARILVNLVLVVATAALARRTRELLGDGRSSLWARGCFGSLALMTSFSAIAAIGVGEASFLHASSGVFTAALAPVFLRQRNAPKVWVAIGGAIFGLFLLFEPRFDDVHPFGRSLALASGLFASLAYLMIARGGRSNAPSTVIFYFCIVAVGFHGVAFAWLPTVWPREGVTYALLASAGVLGSLGQSFLTRAYQNAPAALNSAVSYLQPVLNVLIGVAVFDRHPDARAWLGAAIVVVFGVMLPLTRLPRRAPVA
jgi:S-adenosylmethionine uptake transporter